MPIDTKRISGPESSNSPLKFQEDSVVTPVLNKEGKRADGRGPEDARPIFLKADVISQAKGSAYLEMGNTKIICAVYGPREIVKRLDFSINGQLYCEFKYATFACRLRRQFQQDNEEKDLSRVLKQALEPAVCLYKFPKAQVDVFVTVLDNDGGAFSGAITAAGVALANAGIPMYDLLIGSSLCSSHENLVLDPTESEETGLQNDSDGDSTCCGNVTLGLMPSLQQVTCLIQDGVIEKHVLVQAIKSLTDYCHQLHPHIQKILLKHWKKEVRDKEKTGKK